ncbi:MAG TPA: hypothetical protein DEO60_09555 [Bacteroidales bacterium]|jgi:hypothetical protein|nr:hypothetical protein [Bacteroidales bacterium]
MRKLLFLLMAFIFVATGCKNNNPASYTKLGDYTPYGSYPEKLIGKVEKVVEKNYWAIPEGSTFKKGNPITIKDRDSLNWTNDFEALFDNNGTLLSCNLIDENGNSVTKWEMGKENNALASAKRISRDTLRVYHKLKCNADGEIVELSAYRPVADTLLARYTYYIASGKDTVISQYYDYKNVPGMKGIYLYNDNGQFIRGESIMPSSGFDGAAEVKYNEKGKMSELKFYDKDKKVTDSNYFTYEYDQKGNWTKAVVKDDRGNVVIEERTYTYFE